MRRIAVSIMGRTCEEIIDHTKQIVEKAKMLEEKYADSDVRVDIIEFRADFYENICSKEELIPLLQEIKSIIGNRNLLFTFRSEEEGGELRHDRAGFMIEDIYDCDNGKPFKIVSVMRRILGVEQLDALKKHLSKDGEQTFDLIAGNMHVIGKVKLTVKEGKVTVSVKTNSVDIAKKGEFLTFLPSLAETETLDQSKLTAYKFDEEIDIEKDLGGDTNVLLYILNRYYYTSDTKGVERFFPNGGAYKKLAETLKEGLE